MVSKELYYERKAAGLCTKCGKTREGSPSNVRCLACHNKLKKKSNNTTNVVQGESTKEKGSVENTVKNLKQNTVIDSTANQKICQKCGIQVLTFNLICQKCLKETVFTKYDAISRYGNKCSLCAHDQVADLKIVSSEIEKPLKQKDQELFRLICYRRIVPSEYCVLCHNCYWKQNLLHLKQLKAIFDQKGIFEEYMDDKEDILDI